MWKFCKKSKGAISVFLTLILIPTFIFSGVLVDGSRILGAKNLISGAGELAMNGALSNYHEELNKTYGLLAMASTAEEVNEIMQDFFKTTLNYSGLREEDVGKALVYLELVDGSFYTSNIPESEIFQTEVLKQEILEYMKFRAPVTGFRRGIKDKLDDLKNMKLEKDAVDEQLEFERELDDLQRIFDEIKKRTDELQNDIYKKIYDEAGYNTMLNDVRTAYEEIAMLAPALRCMKEYAPIEKRDEDTETLMKEMIKNKWSGKIDAKNAAKIINMVIISGSVKNPNEVLEGKTGDEYDDMVKLIEGYTEACENMQDGIKSTEKRLNDLIRTCHDKVHTQYELAERGLKLCDEISDWLVKLEKKFEKMESQYEEWEKAVEELEAAGADTAEAHRANLEKCNFFNETKGSMLGDFKQLITKNHDYFKEVKERLDELTFTDRPLHGIDNKNKFWSEADYGLLLSEAAVKRAGQDFMEQHYHKIKSITLNIKKKDINLAGNDFIEKLEKDYCNIDEADPEKAEEYTNEWNEKMEEQSEELEKEDNENSEEAKRQPVKDINLKQYELPSDWIKYGKNSESGEVYGGGGTPFGEEESFDGSGGEERITIGGGLDEDKREDAYDSGSNNLNKDNVGIEEMSGLPKLLTEAGEKVAEPLIMTEYVLEMFSHNTSDKNKEGKTIENPLSLTDDELKERDLYRAEIEYILWGRPELRDNVTITKSIIFAVNMIFNLSFAFTNPIIINDARDIAVAFPVGNLGKIAIMCALQTMVAMIETVKDLNYLMDGKPVPLIKYVPNVTTGETPSQKKPKEAPKVGLKPMWETPILERSKGAFKEYDGKTGMTYEDYIWIMVCVKMFASPKTMLMRTADCIELSMTDLKTNDSDSLKDMYTMIDLEAAVSIDTFFLPKLNGAGYNVQSIDDDSFTINYYGVQGY